MTLIKDLENEIKKISSQFIQVSTTNQGVYILYPSEINGVLDLNGLAKKYSHDFSLSFGSGYKINELLVYGFNLEDMDCVNRNLVNEKKIEIIKFELRKDVVEED